MSRKDVVLNPASAPAKDLARTISNCPEAGVDCSQETDMEAARFVAIFVAIFAGLFAAFFCVFISAFDPSGERTKAARDKRMAEHKMAARLLRLDI
jgi:hypothetical protein